MMYYNRGGSRHCEGGRGGTNKKYWLSIKLNQKMGESSAPLPSPLDPPPLDVPLSPYFLLIYEK